MLHLKKVVRALLNPSSIAIVGASPDLTKLRGRLLRLVKSSGYTGDIFPINPGYEEIQGLRAFAQLSDLSCPPDLALVAVPAAQVPDVLEKAADSGAKSAIVYSAGLVTMDGRAYDLKQIVSRIATERGLPIVGPNTEGFYNVRGRLAATFAPAVEGDVAAGGPRSLRGLNIVSQSGGLGFALFERGRNAGLDFDHVITTGNEGNLECLDFIEYLLAEEETRAILVFVEGFKDCRRFVEIAARAADRDVPLIVMKVGRSEGGKRAAVSHTAHLVGADGAYDAVFRRFGVTRVCDFEEMLSAAAIFTRSPRPRGNRVSILTTSGGAGAWAADTLAAHGLEVPCLESTLQATLGGMVPAYGSTANPVDVTAAAVEDGGSQLTRILGVLVDSNAVDAIVVNLGLGTPGRIDSLGPALDPILKGAKVPVLFHSHPLPAAGNLLALSRIGAHGYSSFRACAHALQAALQYHRFQESWRIRPPGAASSAAETEAVRLVGVSSGLLSPDVARALLEAYDIPVAVDGTAASLAEAHAIARRIGFPVALKIRSPDIAHKTEAGGVALNVTPDTLETAYCEILANVAARTPTARIDGVVVQKMMPPGRELVVGITVDADFGPLLMLGFGGIYVEILKDVVFSPVPVDLAEARRMIGLLRGVEILQGARGQTAADLEALARCLANVSRLIEESAGRITQLDLNPILVYPMGAGVAAVDALVVAG